MGRHRRVGILIGSTAATSLFTVLILRSFSVSHAQSYPAQITDTPLDDFFLQYSTVVTGHRTIVGEYQPVSNPCTTNPCLPCMVCAVGSDGIWYHLTVGGSWVCLTGELPSWNGYTPEWGDIVVATGDVSTAEDIFGNTFYNIEIEELEPPQITYLSLVLSQKQRKVP